MKEANIKKFLYIILVPVIFLTSIIYIGNVLLIGEKIGSLFGSKFGGIIEVFLDICFIFLPFFLIFWQVKSNLFKYKSFCLEKILSDKCDPEELDAFVKTVDDQSLNRAKSRHNLLSEIRQYLCKTKDEVKKKTANIALLAAISVVVSPRSFGDSFCMMVWSCRAINQVLEVYRFRPRGISLIKLYFKVLFSSLLVGSIEEVMENLFPGEKIPLLSPVVQAFAAAFAIFKAAHLTEFYLIHGLNSNHETARLTACREARQSLISLKNDENFKNKSKEVVGAGCEALKEWIKSLFKFKMSFAADDESEKQGNA